MKLTNEQIDEVWGNADFGDTPKMEVIRDSLMNAVCGYGTGSTALRICQDLRLVGVNLHKPRLTTYGRKTLYALNRTALEMAKSDGWQPIESAPKDEFILLAVQSGYRCSYYDYVTCIQHSDGYKGGKWTTVSNDFLTDSHTGKIFKWKYQAPPKIEEAKNDKR